MNKIIYLSIAGFIIKLVFYKSMDKQNKVTPQHFINEILRHNEGFLLDYIPESTDYIIEFLEAKGFDMYESPKKESFIHFYSPVAYHHIATYYHISRVQFIYMLKSAIEVLLSGKGIVMHCSANLVREQAVIYVGKSGTGKTTVVSLLQKEYPILADDEGYLKKEKNKFYFYQGPFLERSYHFSKTSKRYEISSIFFLEQGKKSSVAEITAKDSTSVLPQLIASSKSMQKDLKLLSVIRKSIPYKKLVFTRSRKELVNCILDHSPFDNSSGLNAE